MKIRTLIASVLAYTFISATPAMADACSNAARNAVARTPGAQLLSVQTVNSGGRVVCKVTIKLPPKNNQPGRVVTRNLNPG